MFSVSAIIARINGKGEQVYQNDLKDAHRCLRIKVDMNVKDVPHTFKLAEALCQIFRYPLYEKDYYRVLRQVSRCRQILSRTGSNDLLYVLEDTTNEPIESFSPLHETEIDLISWFKEAPRRIDGETSSRAQGTYALFVNQTEPHWDYMNEALYMAFLHRGAPLAKWHVFYTHTGELPSQDILQQLDGVILTGSKANCDELEIYGAWVTPLMKCLEQVVANGKTKLLGTCFGHQIIGQTFGGTVTMRDGGMFRGVDTIEFTPELKALPCFQKYITTTGKNSIALALTHGREVSKLPPKATLGGFSKTCGVEIYTIGDRVLCFQGHPEYSFEYLTWRGMVQLNCSKDEAEEKYSKIYKGNDSEKALEICVDFMFGDK